MQAPTSTTLPDLRTAARTALPLLALQTAAVSLLLHWREHGHLQAPHRLRAVSALALGATALGALAVGAVAIGALSVGTLVASRLVLGSAELNKVHIRSLTVDKLVAPRQAGSEESTPTPAI